MRGLILVLLEDDTANFQSRLEAALAPFEHTEEAVAEAARIDAPLPPGWDYWTYPPKDLAFNDRNTVRAFYRAGVTGDFLPHTAMVYALPEDYAASGLITPDGTWHDITSFGWRVVEREAFHREQALQEWKKHFHDTLWDHAGYLAVQIIAHS